jgi:hypothetical protein
MLVGFLIDSRFGIDENLRPLSPTVWYIPEKSNNILKQVWFAGIHPSIAGGYSPHAFGDISLCWMVSEVATLTALEFDKDFLITRLQENVPQDPNWGSVANPPYPLLADRMGYMLGPKLMRTPGQYSHPPETVTNEFYHHSVKERIHGLGYPAANAVAKLKMLPYTQMELDLVIESGIGEQPVVEAHWGHISVAESN